MTYAASSADQESSPYPNGSGKPDDSGSVPPPPAALPGASEPPAAPAPVHSTDPATQGGDNYAAQDGDNLVGDGLGADGLGADGPGGDSPGGDPGGSYGGDTDAGTFAGEPAGEVYRSQAAADPPAATYPTPIADGAAPAPEPVAADRSELSTSGVDGGTAGAAAPGLWGDGAADRYRDRFREIQIRFVDEPGGATGEARDLVSELFQELWETLSARKAEVDRWADGDGEDTEELRNAVRSYRDLVDDLLAR
ncbi:hypothetical protein JQS43_10020 [Natronosporangium hydrolyticum]|uniref:Uncharacterized protein n=1 Tax=Natronosporangium hydrolyticum TaxID=2811111 RepID=A0A895YKR6_9ACTN|nr:hypothetical protein [Natronosporangium hydrolyticum]QSB16575.1 hypothetical protein JQS43_10020 [Natronosporangium hydrolyticum]